MKEKYTQILLPSGEWLPSLLTAFGIAGLEVSTTSPRCYRYTLVAQALPIVFELVRTNDVPEILTERNCTAVAGFSGTDVFTERGMQANWLFPLLALVPSAPQATLYFGLTPNYEGQYEDLANASDQPEGVLYTTYPNISRDYVAKAGFTRLNVVKRGGKIEGLWRVNSNNQAIIDISSTGKTAEDNGIRNVAEIMRPKVAIATRQNISNQDISRLDDLRERLYLAARRQS